MVEIFQRIYLKYFREFQSPCQQNASKNFYVTNTCPTQKTTNNTHKIRPESDPSHAVFHQIVGDF